jgi:RNA-binding protein 39
VQEIEVDVKDECNKFGPVVHIHVEKESNGFVWLKFGHIPGAHNAVNQLNGRWFAGKQIEAELISEETYYQRFPEAFAK